MRQRDEERKRIEEDIDIIKELYESGVISEETYENELKKLKNKTKPSDDN